MNATDLGAALGVSNPLSWIGAGTGGFVGLLMSEWWIWFLVSFVLNVIFVLPGVFGYRALWTWFDTRFRKPGKGYLRVRQMLPNDQLRYFWLLPTGQYGDIKLLDGKVVKVPINVSKDYVKYDGSVPTIELDENGHQVKLSGTMRVSQPIGQESYAKGYKASYETGKLIGGGDIFEQLRPFLILIVAVALIGSAVAIYMAYALNQKLDALPKVDQVQLARDVANYVLGITIGNNTSIPTPVTTTTMPGIPFIGG